MKADGIILPDEVFEYVAHNIDSNVRDLEGALISLLAQSTLNRKEVDLPLARQMLKNFIKHFNKEISIEYIQKLVCDYFEIPVDAVKSKRSEEHTSELQSLMRISYAVFCLKKKNT